MTSLVNTETGELLETMTRAEAEDFVRFMKTAQEQIPRRIIDAYQRRAWLPLGYASWEVMIAAEGLAIRLPRDERQEMVMVYSAAGLSTRAIAPVLGINQKTVVNDRRSGEEFSSPGRTVTHPGSGFDMHLNAEQAEAVSDLRDNDAAEAFKLAAENEMVGDADVSPRAIHAARQMVADVVAGEPIADKPRPTVTGLDGKAYSAPARTVPRPAAERTMNLIGLYAGKAARAASDLTPEQIRRVRPEAGDWVAGLRQNVEALQRLLDSLDN